MLALKHQHNGMKNNFKGEINSIKTDLTTLQSDIVTAVNELHDTVRYCRQSTENFNDEHCNGVASVKNDVKQIRGKIQPMYEYIDLNDTEFCNKFSNISSLEKRIAKLESKTVKIKEDMKSSLNVNKIPPDINRTSSHCNNNVQAPVETDSEISRNVGLQAEPYVTQRKLPEDSTITAGTSTTFQKTKLIRCPETKLFKRVPVIVSSETGVDSVTPDVCISDCPANCNASRGLSVKEKISVRKPGRDTNHAESVTSIRPDFAFHQEQSASSIHNNVSNNAQNVNTLYYECPVENRFSALQSHFDNLVPGVASFSDVVMGGSLPNQSSIPVRVSDRQRKTLKSHSSNATNPTLYAVGTQTIHVQQGTQSLILTMTSPSIYDVGLRAITSAGLNLILLNKNW